MVQTNFLTVLIYEKMHQNISTNVLQTTYIHENRKAGFRHFSRSYSAYKNEILNAVFRYV